MRNDSIELIVLTGLMFFFNLPSSSAQDPAFTNLPQTHPVILPRAEYFDLTSSTGVQYRIFVAGPTGKIPPTGAPVIYFTDGNGNFPLLLAAAQRQIREELPCVIVGIGYVTENRQQMRQLRSIDLTPPTSEKWAKTKAGPFSDLKTGGQDKFLDFIAEELKPIIERKFKIDPQRQTLFGHSFGGLFALHVLFTHPEMFQTYVAVSPSLWWNDNSILKEEQKFRERLQNQKLTARLLLMAGAMEQPPTAPPNSPTLDRRGPPGRAVDPIKELSERLSTANIEGFVVESRIFPEEQHGSVILPAASRGVRFSLEDRSQLIP